jgi:ABC-type taurine transport system ATPase subunit
MHMTLTTPGASQVQVYLNDAPLPWCVEADDVAGEAWAGIDDGTGKPLSYVLMSDNHKALYASDIRNDDGIAVVKRRGVIRFVFRSETARALAALAQEDG